MPHYLFTSSAPSTGGVFAADTATGRYCRIYEGSCRGLTRGPDGAFYTVTGYRNTTEDLSTVHRIDPRTWETRELARFPLKDSHDLRWIGDSFYLVASVGNWILRLNAACRELDRMQIVEDPRDICHFNCLTEHEGSLYGTLFTLSPGERREKRATPAWFFEGKVVRLDYPGRRFEVVYEPLGQPHSLHSRPDGLYLVESHFSALTRIDLAHGRSERLAQYTGFVRGLCFGESEVVLGTSKMYRKDRRWTRPLPWWRQWQERLLPFSGLLVADPRSLRLRRRIAVPKSQVYDILPLDPAGAAVDALAL